MAERYVAIIMYNNLYFHVLHEIAHVLLTPTLWGYVFLLCFFDKWGNWGPLRLNHLFQVAQLVETGHEDCFHLVLEYFKGDDVLHIDTSTSKQTNKNEKNESNLYLGYESIMG